MIVNKIKEMFGYVTDFEQEAIRMWKGTYGFERASLFVYCGAELGVHMYYDELTVKSVSSVFYLYTQGETLSLRRISDNVFLVGGEDGITIVLSSRDY